MSKSKFIFYSEFACYDDASMKLAKDALERLNMEADNQNDIKLICAYCKKEISNKKIISDFIEKDIEFFACSNCN